MKNLPGLLVFIFLTSVPALSLAAPTSVAQARADTLVHTLDEQGQAALKPIASLKVGDKVLAKSEWKAEGESLSYEPITDVMVTPAQPRRVVDIWLEDGTHLTATEGHPFKTPEGWRDAILLKKGGKLLLPGEAQGVVEITQIAHRIETLTTYNLEVANAHTFFVGNDGVLVHNARNTGSYRECNKGWAFAEKLFNRITGGKSTQKGNSKVGQTADGKTANLHSSSSKNTQGRPTIEIRNSDGSVSSKHRY
jgi:hypothetical protein